MSEPLRVLMVEDQEDLRDMIGLALQAGWTLVTVKLLMVGLLIFFASPTATHALARAAMTRGLKPQLAPPEDASSKP